MRLSIDLFEELKIKYKASELIEVLSKVDPDTEFTAVKSLDPSSFEPLICVNIPLTIKTKPSFLTIDEFDAAYQRYYNHHVKPYVDIELTFPKQQYEDTVKYYGEDHGVAGYLLFVFTASWEDNNKFKPTITTSKVVVSRDGQHVSVPEYLNDHI